MPEIWTEPKCQDDQNAWALWLTAAAEGNRQALAALYDAAAPLLYSLAVRILKNEADAEEIVIDVFAYVWSRGGSFDSTRGTAAGWLVMLTRSRCVDRLRSRGAQRRAEEPARQTPNFVQAEPLRWLEGDRVHAALQRLPAEQRELLVEAYFSGRTQSELAEHFGIPLGTVKTRTRLALSRLRDFLGDRANPMGDRGT